MKQIAFGLITSALFLGSASLAFASVTINSVTVNGGSTTTVKPLGLVLVSVTATVTQNSTWTDTLWGINDYKIAPLPGINNFDNKGVNGTYTEKFYMIAPWQTGTYDANFQNLEKKKGSKNVTLSGSVVVLKDAIHVAKDTTPPPPPPPPADTVAPVIAAHADITATGTQAIAITYANPTATDNVDSSFAVACAPASGSLFPIGSTTVTCTAHDAAGNQATPTTFTVAVQQPAPTDITAPSIISFTPENGSTTVALNTPITVTFNEPLDPASVTSSAIHLHHASNFDSNSPSFGLDFKLAASVSLSADGKTVTLTPIDQMQYATQYYILVAGGANSVTDLFGNLPASNLLDSNNALFTTADAPITQ